jgi:kumamolisin
MALITPLLTLTFIINLVSFQLLHFTFVEASTNGEPVALKGTITPLLIHSHLDRAANPQQRLALSIGLHPQNQATLNRALQGILLSKNGVVRQFIAGEQYIKQFSPTESSYNKLQNFLKHGGLTVTHTYAHRLLLDVTGSIAQIEQILHIKINIYTDADGHTYYANSEAPTLPAWLAQQVFSINGLNNATHWYHESYHTQSNAGKTNSQGNTCPSTTEGGLRPDQFASAYHVNNLYQAHDQGEGQEIALFELSTVQTSDLHAYTTCFAQSHSANHTTIQIINTGSLASGGEGETDAELVLGAAPQLNTLKIYEAANDDSSYLAAWAQIIQDAPAIVASNWSQCEINITPQVVAQENIFFQLAALQGQTILAATGTPGNTACPGDSTYTPISTGIVDPAAQPYVTAVGGTSLGLNNKEATWDVNTVGGGISRYWTLPDWQHIVGVPDPVYSSANPCAPFTDNNGTYCREIPDVALNADPANGYWTYCTTTTAGCDANKPWAVTGGTSAATALWAVVAALTNELYVKKGSLGGADSTIGFLNPLLYQIADDPVKYASSFQHVVLEPDYIGQHSKPQYPATIGYNMAAGLGSYNAFILATNLVELVQAQTASNKPYTGTDAILLQRKP